MATIKVSIVVANIDDVRAVFKVLKIYRSTTSLDGVYTEVTTPSTRLALEAGRLVYDFDDTAGSSTYFYRATYFNADTAQESSMSEAQQGEGDSALDLVSVDDLKNNYLLGVDLTIDDGSPYPNSVFEFYIKSAVSYAEHKFDMPLRPTRYVDEVHDFYARDYAQFMFLNLDKYPVLDVEKIRMVLPGENRLTGGRTFSGDDLYVDSDYGQVNIIPGSALTLGSMGPLLARWMHQDFIPQVFRATYTAGFAKGKCPTLIKDYIGRLASFGPLNIAGDLLGGAGVASQSISIDGLSQSIATTSSPEFAGYGARILLYTKDLKMMEPLILKYYKGIRMSAA